MTGCSSNGTFPGGSVETGTSSGTRAPVVDGPALGTGIASLLSMMHQLIEGDAITQAATFRSAQAAVEFMPTPSNRLRHALAMAVPGHDGSDAETAALALRNLLADGALEPEERMLAEIQLQGIERLVDLRASTAELSAALEAASDARDTANAERLSALIAENQRLEAELEDATEKLDAITTIEQSISERDDR